MHWILHGDTIWWFLILSSDGSGNRTFEDLLMGERWILPKTKTEGMLQGFSSFKEN
jgi:hypothetical protein